MSRPRWLREAVRRPTQELEPGPSSVSIHAEIDPPAVSIIDTDPVSFDWQDIREALSSISGLPAPLLFGPAPPTD